MGLSNLLRKKKNQPATQTKKKATVLFIPKRKNRKSKRHPKPRMCHYLPPPKFWKLHLLRIDTLPRPQMTPCHQPHQRKTWKQRFLPQSLWEPERILLSPKSTRLRLWRRRNNLLWTRKYPQETYQSRPVRKQQYRNQTTKVPNRGFNNTLTKCRKNLAAAAAAAAVATPSRKTTLHPPKSSRK